jgi:hypothetical protein
VRVAHEQIWTVLASGPHGLEYAVAGQGSRESQRVMDAMTKMDKIDIQGLRDSYDGPSSFFPAHR